VMQSNQNLLAQLTKEFVSRSTSGCYVVM
jgi:hypothetical protein